jgi:hypothetical protein
MVGFGPILPQYEMLVPLELPARRARAGRFNSKAGCSNSVGEFSEVEEAQLYAQMVGCSLQSWIRAPFERLVDFGGGGSRVP